MECITTTHLAEQHGVDVSLPRLLFDAQEKKNRAQARSTLNELR